MNKSIIYGLVVAVFTAFGVVGTANAFCSVDGVQEAQTVIYKISNNKDAFKGKNSKMDYERMLAKAEAALVKVQSTPPKYSDAADKWEQIADKAYDLANAAKPKLDADVAGEIIAAARDAIQCAAALQ